MQRREADEIVFVIIMQDLLICQLCTCRLKHWLFSFMPPNKHFMHYLALPDSSNLQTKA